LKRSTTRSSTGSRLGFWGAALIPILLASSILTGREVLATAPPTLTATCDSAALAVCVNDTTFGNGAYLTISGTGLDADKYVAAWVDVNGSNGLDIAEPWAKGHTDASGNFSIPLRVLDVAVGAHVIAAGTCPSQTPTDNCLGAAGDVSTPITVTMTTDPFRFGGGSTIHVSGAGFAPGVALNVWFDGINNSVLDAGEATVSTTTTAGGGFATSLKITARPGSFFVRAGTSTTASASTAIEVGTCWFQICDIDGAQTLCIVGHSPSDTTVFFNDCHRIESNYSVPTPATPNGGFDFNNKGPRFVGAGALAAVANSMLPELGCVPMTAAIANARSFNNVVPDSDFNLGEPYSNLFMISCFDLGAGIPTDFVSYIAAEAVAGHAVPDAGFLLAVIAAIHTAAAAAAFAAATIGLAAATLGPVVVQAAFAAISGMAGIDPVTASAISSSIGVFIVGAGATLAATAPLIQLAILGAAQAAFSILAVTGAIACGNVEYYCDGSEITANILAHPELQQAMVPIQFMQPPFMDPPDPNPCRPFVGGPVMDGTCWGSIIGWAQVVCKGADTNCETNLPPGLPNLAVPGSSGINNVLAPVKCATGNVVGMSIGYDGDLSFDLFDNNPELVGLLNYHNFQPGPGGSEPPGGIDIEVPIKDLTGIPTFQTKLETLRPGMRVRACGFWVADMHMLWNELHPLLTLDILSDTTVTISSPSANAELPSGATSVTASIHDLGVADTHTCSVQWDGAAPVAANITLAPTMTTPGTCVATTAGLSPGSHTATIIVTDSDSSTGAAASVHFLINAPPVLVLPGAQTVQYGGPLTFGISATDIEPGDTVSLSATGLPAGLTFTDNGDRTGTVSGSPQVSVGSFTLTFSADDGINAAVSGTVAVGVTPKPASVSAVADGKVYGSPDPTLTTTNSGFLTADLGATKITFSATRAAGENAGTYTITPAAADNSSGRLGNYTVSINTADFVITPKPASASAVAAGKLYGDPDPSLTTTSSGFLAADLGPTKITFSATRAAGEGVGTYTITPAADDHGSHLLDNYTVTFNTATFTITVTPTSLCNLTKRYFKTSAKYAGLPAPAKANSDLVAGAACGMLLRLDGQPTPNQHDAAIRAYENVVDAMVHAGWLTQTQATFLKGGADAL
jgi:hypothetical protein